MTLGWKKNSKVEQAQIDAPKDPWDLDDPLFHFTSNAKGDKINPFKPRTAMRGTLITGAIGSGKTTGSGDFIAMKFLERGYGGLVLCGKVDEADEWVDRARRAGRSKDVIRFGEGSPYRFNPLAYQMSRTDKGGKKTETMTDMFMALARINNRMRGGSGGGSSDPFWDMAPERQIKAALDVLKLGKLDVTVRNMVSLLISAPSDKKLLQKFERYCLERELIKEKAKENGDDESRIIAGLEAEGIKMLTPHKEWAQNMLIQALLQIEQTVLKPEDKGTYNVAKQFFLLDLPNMGEKLKGSVQEVFYALANSMRGGLLDTYFAQGLSREIMPEETYKGKIIILDFPVHTYGYLGVFAQIIYKRSWQEALQRRDVKLNPAHVFLWIDEYQLFADPDDQKFCTTARSARVAPVLGIELSTRGKAEK